jgi:hypothetical protein
MINLKGTSRNLTNMDSDQLENAKRIDEAIGVFGDIQDFFESETKTNYLTTVISEEDVKRVLNEIESIFLEIEDYEKCAQIRNWREKLNNI